MNLGQAVAVCLYELVRGEKEVQRPEKIQRATAREAERFTEVLLEALRASGYVQPDAAAATEDKVRRLVRRLSLEAADAEVLLGMLRQIVWKVRQ